MPSALCLRVGKTAKFWSSQSTSSEKDNLMALVGANELKRKMLISVEGQTYTVLEVFFASPPARGAATMARRRPGPLVLGGGGAAAVLRPPLRQRLTGAVLEKSFKATEKFAEPDVQFVPASFLYSDG